MNISDIRAKCDKKKFLIFSLNSLILLIIIFDEIIILILNKTMIV